MISTKKQFHLLGEHQRQPSPSLTNLFTQASKPSANGLWGWYLLIGDKTQSLVFGNMNNIV
jgi:hypothetical protein